MRCLTCCDRLWQVTGLLKNKGSMQKLEPLVAWDPEQVYVSGYTKLREVYTAAQGWIAKAAEVLAADGPCHLKTLESLVSEASRIPVSLPDAKVRPSCLLMLGQWPDLRTDISCYTGLFTLRIMPYCEFQSELVTKLASPYAPVS